MAQTIESMSPRSRLLFGILVTAAGLFIVALASGAIPADAEVDAPRWVTITIGGMFAAVGVRMLTHGSPVGDVMQPLVGPMVLVGLLSVLHWVAFGPGVRRCKGGLRTAHPRCSRGMDSVR